MHRNRRRAWVGLLDHLVGARQQKRRNFDVLRLRGLQIDDELEFVRRLHRQVGGIGALEDAMHIGCGAPVLVVEIDP